MLPRDRVAVVGSRVTIFLEIGATAAHGMYDGAAPCAERDCGRGPCEWGRGHEVVCNDATVRGGTLLSDDR
jgi:3-methylcrotonyl-CoA carboxylase beta subunit